MGADRQHDTPTGEFGFIARLRDRCPVRPPVDLGIGDDGAVLRHSADGVEIVVTDTLMEGVDFTSESATPELMGRKSLAVNLSDLAAMGARPTCAFVSVVLPKQGGLAFAERFYDGLLGLAEQYEVTIAGGDTNSWDGPLVCSVTAIGEPYAGTPILRSAAQRGDLVFVTGSCGGSLAGRHLRFEPRLAEAAELSRRGIVHAMIDLSDGLAADLHHILEASGVSAVINADAIPIHPDVHRLPADKSPLERALSDGEDFELLFTVPPDRAADVEPQVCGTQVTHIGVITASGGCRLRLPDGAEQPLPPLGWTHRLT